VGGTLIGTAAEGSIPQSRSGIPSRISSRKELLPSSSSLLTQQEDHQTATNTAQQQQQQQQHHHHHPDSSLHHLHLHYPTNILQLLDLNAGEDEGTFGSKMTKSSNGDKIPAEHQFTFI
jgi:hypothetical protein